jgi:branched-chain amino acid transport system substrate-binding protein
VRIDPDNHHTELWSRIGRVNAEGKFDVIWQSETRVRPDPYFVTASFDDWISKPHQLKRKA